MPPHRITPPSSSSPSPQIPSGSDGHPSQQEESSPGRSAQLFRSTLRHSEHVRNDVDSPSEQTAENNRTVPNVSEDVPKETLDRSEDVPKEEPEQYRTAPTCSAEHQKHTITIREAARIFEEAGVARTERALTNWCNINTKGIRRLDCCYREDERRYYIPP